MTIEIGNGIEEEIAVYEGDDPVQIAEGVKNKHGLDEESCEIIADNIK